MAIIPTQGSLANIWHTGEDIEMGQVIYSLMRESPDDDKTDTRWFVFQSGQTYTERMRLGLALTSAAKGEQITVLIRGMITGVVMNDAKPGESVYIKVDPTDDDPHGKECNDE